MSNIIPPLLSSSPPPIVGPIDDFDNDEFGDFNTAGDSSFDLDELSFASGVQQSPIHRLGAEHNSQKNVLPTAEDQKPPWRENVDATNNNLKIANSKESSSVDDSKQKISDIAFPIDCKENSSSINSFRDNLDGNREGPCEESSRLENAGITSNKENGISWVSVEKSSMYENVITKNSEDDIDVHHSIVIVQDDIREDNVNSSKRIETQSEKNSSFSTEFDGNYCDIAVNAPLDFKKHEVVMTEEDTGQGSTFTPFEITNDSPSEPSENCTEEFEIHITTPEIEIVNVPRQEIFDNLSEELENKVKVNIIEEATLKYDHKQSTFIGSEDFNKDVSVNGSETKFQVEGKSDFGIDSIDKEHWQPVTFNQENENDFGHFEFQDIKDSFRGEGDIKNENLNETESILPSADDDDDFANFTDYTVTETAQVDVPKDQNQDFEENNISDDEFADFSSATSFLTPDATESSTVSPFDVEGAIAIIKELFPFVENGTFDFVIDGESTDDPILNELRDITETKALTYKWAKSNSQNCLLKALNVDMRNILYGPRWNETMPAFAATLGFAPLEPVKSGAPVVQTAQEHNSDSNATVTHCVPSELVTGSELQEDSTIPSARFDWNIAGLTNPLDYSGVGSILLDFDQFASSVDYSFAPSLLRPPLYYDEFKEWTSLVGPQAENAKSKDSSVKDNISVNSLNFNDMTSEYESPMSVNKGNFAAEDEFGDFEDFTSYQASKIENNTTSTNQVPLRETHISSHTQTKSRDDNSDSNVENCSEDPAWLKCTVVTSDTTRKDTVSHTQLEIEEDEFDDFQTSSFSVPTNEHTTVATITELPSSITPKTEETDRSFSTPMPPVISSNEPAIPLQATMNYTSLAPLQPTSITMNTSFQPKIEWPEPGISNDELNNIELTYKPKLIMEEKETKNKTEPSKVESNDSATRDTKQERKAAGEDEDWSDFISSEPPQVPNPIQVTEKPKTNSQQAMKTTSELQLCIPHLNQIQLPRKPTPVITPQGVYMSGTHPSQPALQVAQTATQHQPSRQSFPAQRQSGDGFQPSLISNQYAKQVENLTLGSMDTMFSQKTFTNNPVPVTNGVLGGYPSGGYLQQQFPMNSFQNGFSNVSTTATQAQQQQQGTDDDEWTDFVSSRPTNFATNRSNVDLARSHQPNWPTTNMMPNIITNPVSFDSLQNYMAMNLGLGANKLGVNASNRVNATSLGGSNAFSSPFVPNNAPNANSVPELDFVIPKTRTWKK